MRIAALMPRIERAARLYLAACDCSLRDAIAGLLLAADADDARRYVRTRTRVEELLDQVDCESEPHRFVVGAAVVDAARAAVRALERPIPVVLCGAPTCPAEEVVLETRPRRRRA